MIEKESLKLSPVFKIMIYQSDLLKKVSRTNTTYQSNYSFKSEIVKRRESQEIFLLIEIEKVANKTISMKKKLIRIVSNNNKSNILVFFRLSRWPFKNN